MPSPQESLAPDCACWLAGAVVQVGFYDFVVLPSFSALAAAFPGTRPMLQHVMENYHHWKGATGAASNAQATPPCNVQPASPSGKEEACMLRVRMQGVHTLAVNVQDVGSMQGGPGAATQLLSHRRLSMSLARLSFGRNQARDATEAQDLV